MFDVHLDGVRTVGGKVRVTLTVNNSIGDADTITPTTTTSTAVDSTTTNATASLEEIEKSLKALMHARHLITEAQKNEKGCVDCTLTALEGQGSDGQ